MVFTEMDDPDIDRHDTLRQVYVFHVSSQQPVQEIDQPASFYDDYDCMLSKWSPGDQGYLCIYWNLSCARETHLAILSKDAAAERQVRDIAPCQTIRSVHGVL